MVLDISKFNEKLNKFAQYQDRYRQIFEYTQKYIDSNNENFNKYVTEYFDLKPEFAGGLEENTTVFNEQLIELIAGFIAEQILKSENLETKKNQLAELLADEFKLPRAEDLFFEEKTELLIEFYSNIFLTSHAYDEKIDLGLFQECFKKISDNSNFERLKKESKEWLAVMPGNQMLQITEKQEIEKQIFKAKCLTLFAEDSILDKYFKNNLKQVIAGIDDKINKAALEYNSSLIDMENLNFIAKAEDKPASYGFSRGWGFLAGIPGMRKQLGPAEEFSNNLKKSIEYALYEFKQIPGNKIIPENKRREFINKLTILQQKELQSVSQQSIGGNLFKYLFGSQFDAEITEKKSKIIKEIKEKIYNLYKQSPEATTWLDSFKKQFDLEEFFSKETALSKYLKEQILDLIAMDMQNNKDVEFKLDLKKQEFEDISMKIDVIKILSRIDPFTQKDLPSQIEDIDKLCEHLKVAKKSQATDIYSVKNPIIREDCEKYVREFVSRLYLGIGNEKLNFPKDNSEGNLFQHMFNEGIGYTLNALNNLEPVKNINNKINQVTKAVKSAEATFGFFSSGFNYIKNEIKDIFTKRKSFLDRLFRGTSMLSAAALGGIGIGILVATASNPVSAAVVFGGVGIGVVSLFAIAGAAKLSKTISRGLAKYFYKVSDPDLYFPNDKAKKLLGDTAAMQLGNFFKEKIIMLNKDNNFKKVSGVTEEDITSTWKSALQGDANHFFPKFKELLEKFQNYYKDLSESKVNEITGEQISISESKVNEITEEPITAKDKKEELLNSLMDLTLPTQEQQLTTQEQLTSSGQGSTLGQQNFSKVEDFNLRFIGPRRAVLFNSNDKTTEVERLNKEFSTWNDELKTIKKISEEINRKISQSGS